MSVVVLVTATDAGSKANPRADAGSGAIKVNKTTSVMARATATCQNWRLCLVARALVQKAIALIFTPLPLATSYVDGEASFTEFSRAGFEHYSRTELLSTEKKDFAGKNVVAGWFELNDLLFVAFSQHHCSRAELRGINHLFLVVNDVQKGIQTFDHQFGFVCADSLNLTAVLRSVRMRLRQGKRGRKSQTCCSRT